VHVKSLASGRTVRATLPSADQLALLGLPGVESVEVRGDAVLLRERRELLAWTIREGVTNAVRHSAARHVWVRMDAGGVEVADDGRGPAGDPEVVGVPVHQRGNGLAGLRERAAAVGAGVTVSRREGGGFVLRVGW
jgi:signal transduction histidine kinase